MISAGTPVTLDIAEWIEFSPIIWRPSTGREKLAALVAYNTGDGSIVSSFVASYRKKDGSQSKYARLASAFYSNIEADLENILFDCNQLGFGVNASVTPKKNTHASRDDGYQLQLAKNDTNALVDAGAPVGKKTSIEFSVPDWVMMAEVGVKRAYMAALFGAEGTTPSRSSQGTSRFPRQPNLSMCKVGDKSSDAFFSQLKALLADLGVESVVKTSKPIEKFGSTYAVWRLYVNPGASNTIAFFEKVGFVYCDSKSVLAWQWSKYLRAYSAESERRRSVALRLRSDGEQYVVIGRHLGITRGAAHRLLSSIDAGAATTAGHGFPHFGDWMTERWSKDRGLLRLMVSSRSFRPEVTPVWNMLVSSPDHSYLLASGANNFNSFETMSGRVYYPFDRQEHTGNYPFNPKLPIWVGLDFNIDPMSAVIFQPQPSGELWIVDEIVMFGSNTEEVCHELDKRFWRQQNQVTVYPDPAGGQRQHARGETDLDILRDNGFKRIKHRRKHPFVADRVNSVNRLLRSASGDVRLRVNAHCKHVINAFEQTIYKKGSRDVDKDAGVEHSADAAGYCIELEYPIRKVEVGGISL